MGDDGVVTLEFVRTLTAVAALFANVATVALVVVLVAVRSSPGARRLANGIGDNALLLGGLVALAATAGSLYYSEVADFIPCRLCWFQRIAMYPAALVLLVGAFFRDRNARRYGLPMAAIGLSLSTYHYLLQHGVFEEGSSCDPLAPCSAAYVWEFDFISIPYMAGSGFALILALLATSWVRRPAPDRADRELELTDGTFTNRSETLVEEPVP